MDDSLILFIGGAAFLLAIIAGIISSGKKAAGIRRTASVTEEKHMNNLGFLYRTGFRTEEQYHPDGLKVFLYFDYTNRQAALEYYIPKIYCTDIIFFPLDKINECEIIQDGAVVSKEVGSLYGTMIGGYGQISGTQVASTDTKAVVLAVRLQIDDLRIPSVIINILDGPLSKTDQSYQSRFFIAQEIFGKFRNILLINNSHKTISSQRSANAVSKNNASLPETADEQIRKLCELKNEGIFTEQEFEKKKQLLIERNKRQ